MARVSLPGTFWLLKRLGTDRPDGSLCCNDLGYLYAFSDVEKAYDFQYARLNSEWATRPIQRRQLPDLVEELKQHGYKGLCFDCQVNGQGGEALDHGEIEQIARGSRRD